jgi:hypothetical protein
MDSDLQMHITNSDGKSQKIFDAIINQQDLFTSLIHDHGSQNIQLHQTTRVCIQDVKTDVRADVARYEAENTVKSQVEHGQTRDLVQLEFQRLRRNNEGLHETTVTAVQSSQTTIVSSVEMNSQINQADNARTQSQIAELKISISILTEQIKARDQELKQLLTAFSETKNAAKRKRIGERSNAVTAALLALQTMYNTLLVSP